MNLPKATIHPNGAHKALPDSGGALSVDGGNPVRNIPFENGSKLDNSTSLGAASSAAQFGVADSAPAGDKRVAQVLAKRTIFPVDAPAVSTRTLYYELSRYYIAGAPIFRWLLLALLVIGVAWVVSGAPAGWLGGLPWLLAALLLFYLRHQARDYGYVYFDTIPPPTLEPVKLSAEEKYPIHATGHFSVENKEQYDTWLPGFYRTFATREHALLCQVVDKRVWKFGRRPPDELGMWYIFFTPDMIEGLRWGKLYFGAHPQVAIAVDYKVVLPAQGRFRSERTKIETLFIATQNEADARAIMADLLYDLSN